MLKAEKWYVKIEQQYSKNSHYPATYMFEAELKAWKQLDSLNSKTTFRLGH